MTFTQRKLGETVLESLKQRGEVKLLKNGEFRCRCLRPERHKNFDAHPSMDFNLEKGSICRVCGFRAGLTALAKELGIEVGKKEITLDEFAEAKGLSADFLQDLGWEETKLNGKRVLKIPYLNEEGEICATRFRHSLDGNFKFSWKKGDKPLPYGLQRLRQAREQGYVVIVEGETDSIALWQNGFPALGIPGAAAWKKQWADYIRGLRVYIWQEPDEAGRRFVERTAESVGECRVIKAEEVKDICELYSKHPEDFAQRFQSILDKAEKWEGATKALTGEEIEKVKPLLNEPHLLRLFIEEIDNSGVVSEEKLAGILALTLESRNTDRPINAGIISPSSSGKNHLLKAVLERFPEESYVCRSGGSERSFIFSDEDLENRFLIFSELRGYSTGETGKALLHSLTWDNKVDYEVTVRQRDGQYRTNKINKPGPTGLLFTSTNLRGLDEELKNRLFLISTQPGEADRDSVERQTKGVLYSIADRLNGLKPSPSNAEDWKALFRVLMEPAEVEISWGRWLTDRVCTSTLAIRRKFELLLYLAYSSALLHRFHRKRNGGGKIVADARDYANAWALIGREFEAEQKEGVSSRAREIARLVQSNYVGGGGGLSVGRIAEALGISPQAVHKHLDWLDGEGYVSKISGGKGKAVKVMPGEPLPEEPEPLPRPEELAADFPDLGGEWKDPVSGREVWLGDNRDLDDRTPSPENPNEPNNSNGGGGGENVENSGLKVETEAGPASEKFQPSKVETGLKFKPDEVGDENERLKGYLRPLDSLYSGMVQKPNGGPEYRGLEMIAQELIKAICTDYNLKPIIPQVNEPFDYNVHEVIGTSSGPEDKVIALCKVGFRKSNGQLLRPAAVIVGSGSNERESDKDEFKSLNQFKLEGVETFQLRDKGSFNLKPEKSGFFSLPPPSSEDSLQQEWGRMSIPQWRKILAEAIEKGDTKRADYARWMLHEVLGQSEEKDDKFLNGREHGPGAASLSPY